MTYRFDLTTTEERFYDITQDVEKALKHRFVQEGFALVFCPHTTAGITVNEKADPSVARDLSFALKKSFPDRPEFTHLEGNSAAHLKASMIGCSIQVPVIEGKLFLGRWQGIFFCEFDPPRHRQVYVILIGE